MCRANGLNGIFGGKLCMGQRAWVAGLYLSGPLQYKDLARHVNESGN